MPKSQRKAHTPSIRNAMDFTPICCGVHKDLGLADDEAAILLMRSVLLLMVKDLVDKRGWTQQQAALHLGIHQPIMNDLAEGRVGNFSLETLMSLLHKLGKELLISVKDREVA
jgi:predicted XRE-type DNA-binding protein